MANDVLAVASSQTLVHTQFYPNPAHTALHLMLDASAQPQQATLLTLLGQPVLHKVATQADVTLEVASLAAGTYLLRVDYASGAITQRVVID